MTESTSGVSGNGRYSANSPLIHLVRRRPAEDQRSGGLYDVPASAVVEGHGQRHPPVVAGQRS